MNPHFSNLLLQTQATYCYMSGLGLIVRKETVSELFARNLARAMEAANNGQGISQSALAALTHVGQTTMSLYLRPAARNPSDSASPSPTLERVAILAKALHTEPWLLMHPDPEQAARAHDLITHAKDDRRLPTLSGLAVHQPYMPYGSKQKPKTKRSK
jgi:transcriptional regulator with XRE-family HTH domain